MHPNPKGSGRITRVLLATAALVLVSACATEDEPTYSYEPDSSGASSSGGFSNESDAELIDACMSGGSSYSDCEEIVVPLVRAADSNDNGIADYEE